MTKIKVLNAQDVNKLINMNMAITAVLNAYTQKNSTNSSVWPLVFYEYEHNVFDLDIRSGNLEGYNSYGLKVISYNELNPERNIPKVNATGLIFNSTTGEPTALLNVASVTSYRTGASAAIGAKYLARKDSKNALIVGCGNVALYSIIGLLTIMPQIENIVVCNPKNHTNISARVQKLKDEVENILKLQHQSLNANIISSKDLEESVKNSDIIITATPSEKAMIDSSWVKEGTHFSCMGAGMPNKQEIDANIFKKAIIFADDTKQCREVGEIQRAFKDNIITSINGEIGELILNQKEGRTSDKDITIFDSTGIFLQDLALSIELLKKAESENVGIDIEI